MRGAEQIERERSAFSLAAAYASSSPVSHYSPSPRRTVAIGMGGLSASRRPISARSTDSRRLALRRSAARGRASSARSRSGWVEEADEHSSLGIDFRRRREDTARKRRTMLHGGPVHDLEDLDDENRRLKVALSRAIDENKRYRVNKMCLEGELLRADGKIDLLLAELEQTPGKRNQRLLTMARCEIEKCAVVRMLAKQKGHLKQLLVRQARELDVMKQTKEWSAVVEMTAATEEYFLEVQRLQRLLAQERHRHATTNKPSSVSPPGFHGDEGQAAREEYNPNRGVPTRRRSSGVDAVVWSSRPEAQDGLVSIHSPVGVEQCAWDGLGVVECNAHRQQSRVSAAGEYVFANAEHGENIDPMMLERGLWTEGELQRRPLSPKRRVSPPHRAQMVARTSRGTEDPQISYKTVRHPGSGLRRRRSVIEKGGAWQSQLSIQAASAATRKFGSNFHPAVAGAKGRRPVSAPRRRTGTQMESGGRVPRAASASLAGRDAAESSKGGASTGSGASGQGARRGSASVRTSTRDYCNTSSVSALDNYSPGKRGTTRSARLDPRPRSTSPRASSPSNGQKTRSSSTRMGVRVPRDAADTSDSTQENRGSDGRKDDHDHDRNHDHDADVAIGEFDTGSLAVAASPPPDEIGLGDPEAPPSHDHDGQRSDAYRGVGHGSSSMWTRESLASATIAPAAVPVAPASEAGAETGSSLAEVKVRKKCPGGINAEVDGPGQKYDTNGYAYESNSDPPGCSEVDNAAPTEKHGPRAAQAIVEDKPGRDLAVAASASCEGDEAPNERVRATPRTEEGSARSVLSVDSHDSGVDGRGSVTVEDINRVRETTETGSNRGIGKSAVIGGNKGVAPDNTDDAVSGASESENSSGVRAAATRKSTEVPFHHADADRRRPTVGGGEDSTVHGSSSSSPHARAMSGISHHIEPAAEDEMNKLLFDDKSDIARNDELLDVDKGAVQSEYGDDFDDDFEDEES